ncbi:MAG: response regulator [Candidatus Omnitrophica bacterium]|nr:response regulator [Candidatus Omnitrophota bacterium]
MSKKILLVDDEQDFLEIMSERIRSWGYEVIEVSSANKVIDTIKKERPGLAILDYMMPDTDGITILKKIRKVDRDLPVIMFTAHTDSEAIEQSEKLGISAFIPKLSAYTDSEVTLRSVIDMESKKLKKE